MDRLSELAANQDKRAGACTVRAGASRHTDRDHLGDGQANLVLLYAIAAASMASTISGQEPGKKLRHPE